jgi:hypothetical protein
MGRGSVVGGLSVPPGWVTAAPEIRTVARALPLTGATAAPAVLTDTWGNLFSELALASMAGRAMGGTVGPVRGERVRAVSPQPVGQSRTAEEEPITKVLARLRQLGELHDSGVLFDEEFTELKRQLLSPLT